MPNTKAATGLATLALLKVNYDKGLDHISMFVPFAAHCISQLAGEAFTLDQVKELLKKSFGLDIPSHSLTTIVGRLKKRKVIRREGGRYFCLKDALPDSTVPQRLRLIRKEHQLLAQAFQVFARNQGFEIETEDQALDLLLRACVRRPLFADRG